MTDNTNRVAGVMSFSLDGTRYLVKGTVSYKCSGSTREPVYGKDGFHGYKEVPVVGEIKVTLTDAGGLSVSGLNGTTNSTIVLGLANGKQVVGRNMFNTEPPNANVDEAELEAVFNGPDVTDH
jgi:hypothetical protein